MYICKQYNLLISSVNQSRISYIQIDDCWAAGERNAAGAIVPDPIRFPSGMKALADYVHGKGMKLGLYGDIGDHTCGGFIGFNVSAVPDPVADAKLAADAETMLLWGMDSLKVDGCAADMVAVRPPIHPSIHPSIHPPIHPSIQINAFQLLYNASTDVCNSDCAMLILKRHRK